MPTGRNQSPSLLAGGNISPMTFVKLSAIADNTGLQAGAGEAIIGISQVGPALAPGTAGADAFAAHVGEQLEIFGLGDICDLQAGAGGWAAGDKIKSGAGGVGVVATTTGNAVALAATAVGAFGKVQISAIGVPGA